MGEICTFNVKVFADTIIRKKRMLKGRTGTLGGKKKKKKKNMSRKNTREQTQAFS